MLNDSHKAITVHKEGGGGGTLILFDTCVGSGHFFCFKFLNYIIFLGGWGVRNINIFGDMKILWIFLVSRDKIGLVLGVSSVYFRVFWRQTVDAGPNPT